MENNELKIQSDPFVVCPICFKPSQGSFVAPESYERRGLSLREYYLWCEDCSRGFNVIQYRLIGDTKWFIHKFRQYAYLNVMETTPPQNKAVLDKDWKIINEFPAPPPVMLGPGGDYDVPVELQASDLLAKAADMLKKTAAAITEIYRVKNKKSESNIKDNHPEESV